ncbi:MAG: HD domain-containing protein [Erysipelothrix sp.]|nr:HD domain-containing protein [Erysipelothrix sp.]
MNRKNSIIYNELIAALSLALDMDCSGKLYHAWRTGLISLAVAQKLNIPNSNHLFYGGLLHDIGAIGLDDHIVHQTLKPNPKYKNLIISHSKNGAEIVKLIPGLSVISKAIFDHHENWDGSGYPNNKKGSDISIGGQIICIADVFDIMVRFYPRDARGDIIGRMAKYINKIYSANLFLAFEETMSSEFFETLKDEQMVEDEIKRKLNHVALSVDIDHNSTAFALASIIDTKHKYTAGHSHRVAIYSAAIANVMELPVERAEGILIAGMLHDVGKISVPSYILDKPGKLTDKEFDIVRLHPKNTAEVLSMVTNLRDLAPIAGGHHERVDGKGYPLGLKKSEIHLDAKILSIADAFDAMTSIRPYQKTKTPLEALRVIQAGAGRQFDKDIVEICKCLLESEEFIRNGYNVAQLLHS